MRVRFLTLVPAFLLLVACSHPLAGNWAQEVPGGKKGMNLEFDTKSDKLMVHTAPREDGSHDHLHGTYTFDDAAKAVTVKCKLMGEGKADTWTGKLDGEHLELAAADGKLKFHHGGAAHGH